ncbi:unnamed protein product [Rhodiola kirilowii]
MGNYGNVNSYHVHLLSFEIGLCDWLPCSKLELLHLSVFDPCCS